MHTFAKFRFAVVMLDLECAELVNEMFKTFFAVARFTFVTYIEVHLLVE